MPGFGRAERRNVKMKPRMMRIGYETLTRGQKQEIFRLVQKFEEENKNIRYGEMYWYFDTFGELYSTDWCDTKEDRYRYNTGNYYKSEEVANYDLQKKITRKKLERYAEIHNDLSRNIWDGKTLHFYICYDLNDKDIRAGSDCKAKRNTIYFTSLQTLFEAIEAVGKEDVKKYYLEVEE